MSAWREVSFRAKPACLSVCFLEIRISLLRCSAGQSCSSRTRSQWHTWIIMSIVIFLLFIGGYTFLRYNLKWIRMKYLFGHRRLHEHIGLEVSAHNTGYSHLPTSDMHCHDRPLEDVLFDEDHLVNR